ASTSSAASAAPRRVSRPIKDVCKVLELLDMNDSELSDLSDGDDENDPDFDKRNVDEDAASSTNEEESDDNDEPADLQSSQAARSIQWRQQEDFTPDVQDFTPQNNYVDSREDWTPIEYVKQYLDNELFEVFSNCTNIS